MKTILVLIVTALSFTAFGQIYQVGTPLYEEANQMPTLTCGNCGPLPIKSTSLTFTNKIAGDDAYEGTMFMLMASNRHMRKQVNFRINGTSCDQGDCPDDYIFSVGGQSKIEADSVFDYEIYNTKRERVAYKIHGQPAIISDPEEAIKQMFLVIKSMSKTY